jgi:hypothetical protein
MQPPKEGKPAQRQNKANDKPNKKERSLSFTHATHALRLSRGVQGDAVLQIRVTTLSLPTGQLACQAPRPSNSLTHNEIDLSSELCSIPYTGNSKKIKKIAPSVYRSGAITRSESNFYQ